MPINCQFGLGPSGVPMMSKITEIFLTEMCIIHKVNVTQCLSPISDMVFHFLTIGAAQGSNEKNGSDFEQLLRGRFSCFHGQKKSNFLKTI